MTDDLHRCRLDDTGVSTCPEWDARQPARATNDRLGLSNAGLDQWELNHLKASTDHKQGHR